MEEVVNGINVNFEITAFTTRIVIINNIRLFLGYVMEL